MSAERRLIGLTLTVAACAHAALLRDLGIGSVGALLVVTVGVPGLLLAQLLLRDSGQPWAVCLLLGIAGGFALFPTIALLVSYWPGPLTLLQLLIAFDLLAVILALLGWRTSRRVRPTASNGTGPTWTQTTSLALLSVLLLASYFRMANLSYAELQGDEAKVLLHAVAAVQGDPDVLFLHRRGPTDILAPAAVATLVAPLTEAAVRLPFAVASIVVVGLVFLLGLTVRSTLAGWLAGLLLASEGLFIAFARIVQYQAFIHLSAVGTLYILYLAAEQVERQGPRFERAQLRAYFWLAAIFLLAGLLAHYEAIVIVPAALFLLWRMLRHGVAVRDLLAAAAGPLGLVAAVTAAFYIPFLLHPRFQATLARYGEKVVGDFQRFFDHLALFIERGSFYNFYAIFWLLLALFSLYPLQVYWRGKSRSQRIIGSSGALALLLPMAGVLFPSLLPGGATPLLVGYFLLVATLAPAATTGERMLWLWLGPALFLSLFLIRDPNLHFYIFLAPWALLVAIVLDGGWLALRSWVPLRMAQFLAGCLLLLLLSPRLLYAQRLYIDHSTEIQRNWANQEELPVWLVGANPAGHPIFGFPHNSGWKTVGVLYDQGVLGGSYTTNIRDWVSAWYTRSAEYCEEEGDWIILETVERPEEQAELRAAMGDRYVKRGEVYVGARLGLEIYGRNAGEATEVERYQAEDHARYFNAELADADLHPVVMELDPALEAIDYRFGDELALTGYRLAQTEVEAGDALSLLLRWEVRKPPSQDYALFAQVLDATAHKYGQRDGAVACGAGPVNEWTPGESVVGHYRIPLDPATPPAAYPLLFGLYGREDGARLPVFAADGSEVGDGLTLSTIEVSGP